MIPRNAAGAWILGCGIALLGASAVSADQDADPSFLHGAGRVLGGVCFELPRTVLDATLTEPPVLGTMVGLLAGTARAVQATAGGLVEMAAGFDPWGTKRKR